MNADVRELAIEKLRAGSDLVSAIIDAVFELWPECLEVGRCGTEKRAHCVNCAAYSATAPEVLALNEFRSAVGTRVLGSWRWQVEGSWAASHSPEDAVSVLQNLKL